MNVSKDYSVFNINLTTKEYHDICNKMNNTLGNWIAENFNDYEVIETVVGNILSRLKVKVYEEDGGSIGDFVGILKRMKEL